MLLSDNRRVISELSVMAMVFVMGIAVGFHVPEISCAWGWLAGMVAWGALVCRGWNLPCPRVVLVFLAGCVLALRTECALADVKDHAQFRPVGGAAPLWRVEVEGGVNVRRSREKGISWAQFMSHLGPQPVKVVMPIAKGKFAPRLGEVWECEGWLTIPKDERRRYRIATLWVAERAKTHRVVEAKGWRKWRRALRGMSGDFSRRVGIGLSWCPEVAALNRAMLLGRRAEISAARKNSFVVSGTVHVFAISGLHVMLIAHLLEKLLKAFGMSIRWRGIVVVVLVALYVIVTGARASAVRAALMAGLYYSAAFFGRKPDSMAAWSLAVFVVYGLSPERFFDVGCALSFTVMLGVVVWLKWTRAFSCPEAFRSFCGLPYVQWLRAKLGWLFEGYGISFAAWVVGTPVAARLFGRFTWGGLIANIAAVKLASCAVAFGFFGIALSYVSDVLAAFFNLISAAFTFCLLMVAEMVSGLPDVSFSVSSWTLMECMAWYGVLILTLMTLERLLPRRNDISGEWW